MLKRSQWLTSPRPQRSRWLSSPTPVGAERRRQPRVAANEVRTMLRVDDLFQPVRALDLGSTGARVQTFRVLPVGTSVAVNLSLGGRLVAVPGRVAWSSPRGQSGLAFEPMGGSDSAALHNWINRQPLV